ncbi:MAG: hypothetical protein Kow0013_25420 [Pararhodobacter sp.]
MPAATLVLIALGLVFALAFWRLDAGNDDAGARGSATKTLGTALLALAGASADAPAAITLGLALGALGDFALSRRGDRWFLLGMGAFAAGHGAYIAHFAPLADPGATGALLAPVALVMVALVLVTILWIAPRAGALCLPVRLYALVIAAMALSAAALTAHPGRALSQIGVASFVASDLVLALRLFVLSDQARKRFAARLLWPLYWGGQALILWGALA